MKRFISFLLSLVMILSLFCGCEKTDISSENSLPQKADLESTSTDSSDTSSELTVSVPEEPKPVTSKPVISKPVVSSKSDPVSSTVVKPPVTPEPEKLVVVPEPKYPYGKKRENHGDLDEETVEKLKLMYADWMYTKHFADRIYITYNFGTFSDGSIALRFDRSDVIDSTKNVYKHVGKYWCIYFRKIPIMIYKNDKLYKLDEAYKDGIITDKILDELFTQKPFINGTKYYEYRLKARKKQLEDWLKSPTVKETRYYWKGSADGDFVEGEFIISLTLEASKKNFYKEYTPKDFPEIDCESVEPLGEYQREGILSEKYNDEEVGTLEDLDLSKFRRMFVINLKEKTKQAVYDGIHALDGREDISSASPNHRMYPC